MRSASILLLLSLGCSAFRSDSQFRVYRHANGHVAAEGRATTHESMAFLVAETSGRAIRPWQQYLRVGPWRYFDDTGNIQAEVSYRLGSYTECCAAGPCDQLYEIITDTVRTYASDGTIAYEGPANNEKRTLATNCEGGDSVYVSSLTLPSDILPAFAQSLAAK